MYKEDETSRPQPIVIQGAHIHSLQTLITQYIADHPFYDPAPNDTESPFSFYDEQVNRNLATYRAVAPTLDQSTTSTDALEIHDYRTIIRIRTSLEEYLAQVTDAEIEQHGEDELVLPFHRHEVEGLRKLYMHIALQLEKPDEIDYTLALKLGIPDLIPYSEIWKYATSDPIKEDANPGWAKLNRQALHLMHLLAERDPQSHV